MKWLAPVFGQNSLFEVKLNVSKVGANLTVMT